MKLTNNLTAKGIAALAAVTIGGNFLFKKNEEPITQLGISDVYALLNTAIPKGVGDKSIGLLSFKLPEDVKVVQIKNLLTLEQSTTNGRVTNPDDNVPEDFNPDERIITVAQDCEAGKFYTLRYNNSGKSEYLGLVISYEVAKKVVQLNKGDTIAGRVANFHSLDAYIPGGTEIEPGNVVVVSDIKRPKQK